MMDDALITINGEVKIFPQDNPWVYVPVPKKYTEQLKLMTDRGLVPITVTLGKSTWDTSLMPMGDGTQFIPLSAKIRRFERIVIGDHIELSFIIRER